MTQLTGIANQIVFVTGAGGGIGAEVVRELCGANARVVAVDIDSHTVAALAEELGPQRVWAEVADVGDAGQIDALVSRVEAEWGAIGLGVNIAGVLSTTLVTETDDETWQRVFHVNAQGVFNVSRALARVMQPRQRGSIVTVSSNAAGVPRHGMAAYAASKAAATMFMRCLGLELAPYGIRCNIVAPGSTRTPMQTGMWADEQGERQVIAGSPETYKAGIPLRKLAEPGDVANAVLFLLSDQASHITMADLYVDGGATLRA